MGAGAVPPLHANQDSRMVSLNPDKEFSSLLFCPFLVNKSPINRVSFDIPDSLGNVSQQVFEESHLFKYIPTPGAGSVFHQVKHPLVGECSHHDIALQSVISISLNYFTSYIKHVKGGDFL